MSAALPAQPVHRHPEVTSFPGLLVPLSLACHLVGARRWLGWLSSRTKCVRFQEVEMQQLIQRAFQVQQAAQASGCTVPPEMPILYFGNLDAYRDSAVRIVTVAANPSSMEFPAHDPLERFSAWRPHVGQSMSPIAESAYQRALADYFTSTTAHWSWFRHLEPVLHGFDASFRAGKKNRALHTDLLSPVATHPKWGELKDKQQTLMNKGVPLWHELIAVLEPHVLLVSVAPRYKSEIAFPIPAAWRVVHQIQKPGGLYRIEHQAVTLNCGAAVGVELTPRSRVDLVYGEPFRQPFGGLTNAAKSQIGGALAGHLTNW